MKGSLRGLIALCGVLGTSCSVMLDFDEASRNRDSTAQTGAGSTQCIAYQDLDADGFGSDAITMACPPSAGFVLVPGDCNDDDPQIHPDAKELCDGIDNDCGATSNDICPDFCQGFTSGLTPYMICGLSLSHNEARAACADQHMKLAKIDSVEENSAVAERVETLKFAWIGGRAEDEDGIWRWEDGSIFYEQGTPVSFTAWSGDEQLNPDNGHCLEMYGDGNWGPLECDAVQSFVCERY